MLLSFAVRNFLSIRDEQRLSMYRAARNKNSEWPRPEVSPIAAIYGSNAAGKTTVTAALRYLSGAVDDSYSRWDPDGGTEQMPFLLDATSASEPTEIDVEFVAADGIEYKYGFSLDGRQILTEYLYQYKTSRRTVLFERDVNAEEAWYFGPSFRGPALQIRETTRRNSLFLSAAAAAGNETTRSAHAWLTSGFSIYPATAYAVEHRRVIRKIRKDDGFRSRLLTFLAHADLGVSDVTVIREEMEPEDRAAFEEALRDQPPSRLDDFVREQELTLSLLHRGSDVETALPFVLESDGTQALISFASIAMKALEAGSVCIIDEIDSSLHPLLVAELVAIFQDPRINPKQAQLVFTTHDVSLLETRARLRPLLERDQIWVVEKDATGASSLTAISDYRTPRKEENLARGYLTGRYGGLPTLSIVSELAKLYDEAAPDLAEAPGLTDVD